MAGAVPGTQFAGARALQWRAEGSGTVQTSLRPAHRGCNAALAASARGDSSATKALSTITCSSSALAHCTHTSLIGSRACFGGSWGRAAPGGAVARRLPTARLSHTSAAAPAAAPEPHPTAPPAPSGSPAPSKAAGAGPRAARAALVLGIESSCDDTGVAVVASDGAVLGEALASQHDVHAAFGGVVPNLARDAHAAAIDATVDAALAAAGVAPSQLTAVAVTIGPGLGLCLRVGAAKAREVARRYGIPIVAVHHMEAHALVARLPPGAAAVAPPAVRLAAALQQPATAAGGSAAAEAGGVAVAPAPAAPAGGSDGAAPSAPSAAAPAAAATTTKLASNSSCSTGAASSSGGPAAAAAAANSGSSSQPAPALDVAAVAADVAATAAVPFPFLCLLVSGGHNLLVLVKGVGQYVQLGTTMDDALGEAYDKVARLLGLELRPHGGAALEALAREGDPTAFKFAVPMRKYGTCDFSFAGLKTSSRLAIERHAGPEAAARLSPAELRKVKADIAASFQSIAVLHLVEKTRRGVAWARELAPGLGQLVVAGGVACNALVRSSLQQLAEAEGLALLLPPPRWCTDNGVMVAWAGMERLALGWAEPPPPLQPPVTPPPAVAAHATHTEPQQGQQQAQQAQQEAEWIELKPRWPLTAEMHPRSEAARKEERRSVKRVRLARPLSEMAPPAALAAAAASAAAAAAGAGSGAGATGTAQPGGARESAGAA